MLIRRGRGARFGKVLLFFCLGAGSVVLPAEEKKTEVSLERVVDLRSSDKDESRLMLTLKIQGEIVSRALEYGGVLIREPAEMGSKISGADEEGFAPLKRGGFGNNLSEGLLSFELPSPPRNQGTFPVLTGVLKLKTYRQQVVPIEKVSSKLNQAVPNPLFKAHGIEVRVVDPRQAFPGVTEESEVAKLLASVVALEVSGETRKVREFYLETPDGKGIMSRAGSFGAGRTLLLSRRADEPLPSDVVAKVVIPVSPEVTEVPFRLERVELP